MDTAKTMLYCFLIVLALITFLFEVRSQDLTYSLPAQQSGEERGQLSSSSSNGDLFVGAGGSLVHLSSELQLLQSVPIPDSPSVLGLTTTADGDYLVACFSNRRCAVYNTTTLNTVTNFNNENFLSAGLNYIALFTAPVSSMQTFFIGFGDSSTDRFRLLQRGFAGSTVTQVFQSATNSLITRVIYEGFVYGSNAYFLALDAQGLPPASLMYIIRVCNDGQLAARYELQLTCGGTALSSSSVITGVSEVNGNLVVSVDGRVCSHNLTTIDTILDNYFTTCLVNDMGANNPQFGQNGACSLLTVVSIENISLDVVNFEHVHLLTVGYARVVWFYTG